VKNEFEQKKSTFNSTKTKVQIETGTYGQKVQIETGTYGKKRK